MTRRVIRLEHGVTLQTGVRHPAAPEYRALASAVLLQAFRDANAGDSRAIHFLRGGPSLAFWSHLATLDVNALIERAARIGDAKSGAAA